MHTRSRPRALRLYAGDFLQGLSIDGCAGFQVLAHLDGSLTEAFRP